MSVEDKLEMTYSKLDRIYRSILLSRYFIKGWGSPENLKRLLLFRKVLSNRSDCFKLVGEHYPIEITKDEYEGDIHILEGHFYSPFNLFLPTLLPKESKEAHFQMILPKTWKDDGFKPVCIHMAGTGDHYFWRRRHLTAKPLLREAGIGSIILENPFYGIRKPVYQLRSVLNNVSDIFVMGGCLILEALVLFHWCTKHGFGPLGVSGLSMGGHEYSMKIVDGCGRSFLLLCVVITQYPVCVYLCILVIVFVVHLTDVKHGHLCSSKKQTLNFFENSVLRKIFDPKKDESSREWRQLLKTELRYLYPMASLAATNWPFPLVLVPCLSWSTASGVFTEGVMSRAINWDMLEFQYKENEAFRKELNKMVQIRESDAFQAGKEFVKNFPESMLHLKEHASGLDMKKEVSVSRSALLPINQKLSKLLKMNVEPGSDLTNFTLLLEKVLNSKYIDRSSVSSNKQETINFMRGIMDECTHLKNFSVPVDTSLIISVCARDDGYVPRDGVTDLSEIWPGADVRFIDAGHVSAFVLHQKEFRQAIIEAFERYRSKYMLH